MSANYREWSIRDEFNPFNTFKILKHLDYWAKIDVECPYVPPPIAVTVDPTNNCNYNCLGCNAQKVIREGKSVMSSKWMSELPDFFNHWGVKSVTLAGGGEPLMHPYIDDFFERSVICPYELGLITNGFLIDRHMATIALASKWVGVSVDASNENTYAFIKNTDKENYNKVIKNIASLTMRHKNITFKFLINKHNIDDIPHAIRLAKDLGCCAIHLRPMGITWYEDDKRQIFTADDVEQSLNLIGEGRQTFEDDTFRVFGVTHKFDKNWQLANCFEKCWACFMYLVIEPSGIISTCCDNRGNPDMQLATGLESPWEILKYWGSKKHVELFNKIDVKKCPRCTFSLHNQCYEKCILEDQMDSNFI